jgi:hypothetical protein
VNTDVKQEIVLLAVASLAVLLRYLRAWIQTKLTPERLAHLTDLANMAVRAAEQVGEDTRTPAVTAGDNPETIPDQPAPITSDGKYALASSALQAGAKRMGIKLTDAEVSSYIHAALREMQSVSEAVPAQ